MAQGESVNILSTTTLYTCCTMKCCRKAEFATSHGQVLVCWVVNQTLGSTSFMICTCKHIGGRHMHVLLKFLNQAVG